MQELPFFKFFPSEYMAGEISDEPLEVQGFFVKYMARYWKHGHSKAVAMLKRKHSNAREMLDGLAEIGIIDTDYRIRFLDRQLLELQESRRARQEAGRKGGIAKAKASIKEVDKEVDKDKEVEVEVEVDDTRSLHNVLLACGAYYDSKNEELKVRWQGTLDKFYDGDLDRLEKALDEQTGDKGPKELQDCAYRYKPGYEPPKMMSDEEAPF